MTKEEAIKVLKNIVKHNEDEDAAIFMAIRALNEQQPSLPSDLDEAAEEYIKFKPRYDIQQELEEGEDPTEIDCFTIDAAIDIFKAGAEWMAGQGWHEEAVIKGSDDVVWLNYNVELPIDLAKYFKDGDKVIVQIRKK